MKKKGLQCNPSLDLARCGNAPVGRDHNVNQPSDGVHVATCGNAPMGAHLGDDYYRPPIFDYPEQGSSNHEPIYIPGISDVMNEGHVELPPDGDFTD